MIAAGIAAWLGGSIFGFLLCVYANTMVRKDEARKVWHRAWDAAEKTARVAVYEMAVDPKLKSTDRERELLVNVINALNDGRATAFAAETSTEES